MLKLVVSAWCVMMIIQPPSGGCVLKLYMVLALGTLESSRLQAAVC